MILKGFEAVGSLTNCSEWSLCRKGSFNVEPWLRNKNLVECGVKLAAGMLRGRHILFREFLDLQVQVDISMVPFDGVFFYI